MPDDIKGLKGLATFCDELAIIDWKTVSETTVSFKLTKQQLEFYERLYRKMYARRPKQPWRRKTRRKTHRY